ncbi:hypothetical protein ACQ4PT_005895 [Festuca glaucescens]
MEFQVRRWLVFLSLLVVWSTGAELSPPTAAAEAVAVAPPVLDLRSGVGRKRRACVSKALHDFDHKNPSYARWVELRVMDSRGDLATAEHAADDLITNALVQAIIWGPETRTKAEHVLHLGRYNYIPVISFSSIFPTSCTFWLEDRLTNSGGHLEFGFTLGYDSITFLNLKTVKRNGLRLNTRKTSENCQGPHLKAAVPLKYGFKEFVDATDPKNITGYSIDIFEAAMRTLHPSPCYDYFIFHGTYDEIVGNVSLGVYDAAVGDVTVTAERVNGTDFTMPYTQSGVAMLVLAGDEPNTILWTFAKPLSGGLCESRLRTYTTKEEYAQALRLGSNNGGVSAIVDEIPYLTSFLSDRRYKDDFRMLGCIYKTPGFGFAFQLGSPLVHNVSIAILNLAKGDEGSQIEVKWFGTTSPTVGDGLVPDTDSGPLTFHSFSGLFVITGSISTLMLLISISRWFCAKCTGCRIADVDLVSHNSVDEACHPLQDGKGDIPSPHQQPIHEAGNNDAEEVHVSYENVEEGEPAPDPVQLNGMHTGSVRRYLQHAFILR